jgi:hypothetical protein
VDILGLSSGPLSSRREAGFPAGRPSSWARSGDGSYDSVSNRSQDFCDLFHALREVPPWALATADRRSVRGPQDPAETGAIRSFSALAPGR